MHDLIRRAARYGIELYCPIVYLTEGEPEERSRPAEARPRYHPDLPDIRGDTYSLQKDFLPQFLRRGWGKAKSILRIGCATGREVLRSSQRSAERSTPKLKVLPYNINFRPEMVEVKKFGRHNCL